MSIQSPVFTLPTRQAQHNAQRLRSVAEPNFALMDRSLSIGLVDGRDATGESSMVMTMELAKNHPVDPETVFTLGLLSMSLAVDIPAYIPTLPQQELAATQFAKQEGQDPGIAAIQTLLAIMIDQTALKTNLTSVDQVYVKGGVVPELIQLIGIYYRHVKHLGVLASYQMTSSKPDALLITSLDMVRPLT